LRSRPFAWSGRRRIDGAIRCRQLRAITFRRTTHRTPFQCRGCEPLLVLLGPRGAFTEPCRPLTFSWSLEGTPDQPLCRPMRCPLHTRLLRERRACNCDSPSSRRTSLRLARESKTGESPRTPSVVPRPCEPKPANRTSAYFFNCERFFAHRFAVSRLVPASGGAFERPSG
jgi:hypothetical protein